MPSEPQSGTGAPPPSPPADAHRAGPDPSPPGAGPGAHPPQGSAPDAEPPGGGPSEEAVRPADLSLELLVHGVGGTTPQDVLEDPRTVRVTGDSTAGIHRRTDDADAEERPGDYADQPVPEAYCWSNLTSGDGIRALWLVLLPFMVVNLAHWMRPAAPGRHVAQRIYDVLVRLLALSLTVLLTAAACEVALDLVAWQCADSAGCARDKSWLTFLAADQGGWWSLPGRRLLVAALLPLLLTALLWWLSHRTWSAYESASPPPRAPGAVAAAPAGERPALSLPGFWYGRRLVSRLRAAHTSAGLLTIATALLAAGARYDHRPGGSASLDLLGWVLATLVALGWAAVLLVVTRKGRTEAEPDERVDRFASRWLPVAVLAVLLLAAVHTGWERPEWDATGQLPGTGYFVVAPMAQGTLVALLAVVGWLLHRAAGRHGRTTAMAGLAGPAVALLACALGGVLSGGVAQRISEWLVPASTSDAAGAGGPETGIAGPPVVLTWQAAVIPPLLLVVVVFVAVAAVWVLRERRRTAPRVIDAYPGEHEELTSRSRRIALARALAALTDSAPRLVAWIAALTALLGAGAVAGAWLTDEGPAAAARGAAPPLPAVAEISQGLGSWLMSAGVVLLVAMGRRAYRDAAARRTVGILWDVGTFWPRAAHPFAPPCYAERAVPDLTWRVGTWVESTGGRLVLSGHSQGSVLAAAATWQLDTATRSRVALLTYGSPLARLYGCWFPAYFGPEQLRALRGEVDCWTNLWRDTDPIGGPLHLSAGGEDGPPVDRGPLKDPLAYGRTLRDPLPAPILGHGEYQADPVFAEERAALLARLGPRRNEAPPHQPPAPKAALPGPAIGPAIGPATEPATEPDAV